MDKKAKHTPGPWEVGYSDIVQILNTKKERIASLNAVKGKMGRGGLRQRDEVEANARLIAEAPAMLEWMNKIRERGITIPQDMIKEWLSILARIDGE